ncbi:hypothetical protein NP493_4562g00003 [Ridgeia piscesae]|uniref:Uncharacterized protein n=1 Tax=Ridgeia piscesae TaxID=27915 RepID=A0AAD9IZM0_RIDPI|nr:hypothetical protein NP493_4562g00003 [Ridgeia piscesae]
MEDNFSDDDDEEIAEETTRTLFDVLNVTESFDSLKSKLTELWKNHLESVTTSVTDHLSLEHLGYILDALADRNDINRPFPRYLVAGVPNLVVCAQADVLRAVLSLYEEGKKLPLPETDEVLLCTENTTVEEVSVGCGAVMTHCN